MRNPVLKIYKFLKKRYARMFRVDQKQVVTSLLELRFLNTKDTLYDSVKEIAPPEIVRNNIQKSKENNVPDISCALTKWKVDGIYLYFIKDARIYLETGLVYLPKIKKFIHEFCWGHGKYRSSIIHDIRHGEHQHIKVQRPIYPFCFFGYHGIVEDLASVILLHKIGYEFDILISKNNKWMISLLNELRFNNLIITDKISWVSSNKGFLLTSKSSWGEYINPTYIRSINKFFPQKKLSSDRIYISRGITNKRPYQTEYQIEEIFKNNGFKIIRFEEYDVGHQILIIQNAKIIVGLHGAGLTNMVWSRNKLNILELYTLDHYNDCYRALAMLCNHEYKNYCLQQNKIDEMENLSKFINNWIKKL
jgi:hypothetical protein